MIPSDLPSKPTRRERSLLACLKMSLTSLQTWRNSIIILASMKTGIFKNPAKLSCQIKYPSSRMNLWRFPFRRIFLSQERISHSTLLTKLMDKISFMRISSMHSRKREVLFRLITSKKVLMFSTNWRISTILQSRYTRENTGGKTHLTLLPTTPSFQ